MRTPGGGRRYSARDIELLREVQRLSQEEGVNLAGIKRIIELEGQIDELKAQVKALTEELSQAYAAAEQAAAAVHARYRRELVPTRQATALVIWKPRHRRRCHSAHTGAGTYCSGASALSWAGWIRRGSSPVSGGCRAATLCARRSSPTRPATFSFSVGG